MKDEHIIEILEGAPFAGLSEIDLARIRAHTSRCDDCLNAYEAAQIASSLLREHAAEAFTPSPFFQTRVLAMLRERQAGQEAWGLGRLWRATGALVSSMAATVAVLGVLSFVVPGSGETTVNSNVISSANNYSAVYIDESELQEEPTDAQVLTTLYASDEEVVK